MPGPFLDLFARHEDKVKTKNVSNRQVPRKQKGRCTCSCHQNSAWSPKVLFRSSIAIVSSSDEVLYL
ncbi:hypothetical protein NADFUDRAFT_83006 [Nadsonia fulvescens var. elongata DSM 6958]|uniref:Uncharacterized protein n=1 Tax=Nadsonia fulvescens var. elongata DSM 6958 TaxID=857566 RepID=A0A1E3PLF7_9ASCO|nr:hypothetical protein NADFUDRAFT_83006 [Nadsonia fulvescens var. elongata DSM 6958]